MTNRKLRKRSFIWAQSRVSSFIRLEMALNWKWHGKQQFWKSRHAVWRKAKKCFSVCKVVIVTLTLSHSHCHVLNVTLSSSPCHCRNFIVVVILFCHVSVMMSFVIIILTLSVPMSVRPSIRISIRSGKTDEKGPKSLKKHCLHILNHCGRIYLPTQACLISS